MSSSVYKKPHHPWCGIFLKLINACCSFPSLSCITDLKTRKIRVNAVSQGVVPTEGYMTEQGMPAEQVKEYTNRVSSEIPVGKVGNSEEIGNAVVFLASDASSFITGVELTVDGGQTMVYAGKN